MRANVDFTGFGGMPYPLGTQIAVNFSVIAVNHTQVYAILTKDALYLLSYNSVFCLSIKTLWRLSHLLYLCQAFTRSVSLPRRVGTLPWRIFPYVVVLVARGFVFL